MTSITIGNSVSSIGTSAFYGCSGLTNIVVASENTTYDSRDNCNAIIETSSNTLVVGCQNTIIPNSVTSIGEMAFAMCSLASIEIPNSVTSIGDGAFQGCSGLTSVTIPNGVTSIGQMAFGGCSNLESVTIPNSVTSIGMAAFMQCTGLTSVTNYAVTPQTINYAFYNVNTSSCTLYVPAESVSAYSTASVWQDFGTISAIVTANSDGAATPSYWATYYNSTTGFTADANTTVFQAALSGDQLTLTVVPDREIPADKAVILKSSAATITLTPATTTQTLSGNMLQGTTAEMTGAAGNIYVLNTGSGGVGFYKLKSTGTISANKAYLTYSAGAREFFLFDEATGINSATLTNSEKVNNEVYDLQGRRVVNPTKGLYIVNGKKVFINK